MMGFGRSMVKVRKYRSKARVLHWDPWNEDIEPGDLLVDLHGHLFRAAQSRGRNKAAMGELTPITIKPPSPELRAKIIDGEVWWVKGVEKP
jgi:hypothetical protein